MIKQIENDKESFASDEDYDDFAGDDFESDCSDTSKKK